MRITECAVCGLAPCDLPDGVDPEDVFERVDGEWLCQADCTFDPPRGSWSVDFAPARSSGDAEEATGRD